MNVALRKARRQIVGKGRLGLSALLVLLSCQWDSTPMSPSATSPAVAQAELRWVQVKAGELGGPQDDEIRQIAIGPHGGLWVATARGLSRLSSGGFRHVNKQDLTSDQIFALASTTQGLAVASREGLTLLPDAPLPEGEGAPLETPIKGLVHSVVWLNPKLYFLRTDETGQVELGSLDLSKTERSSAAAFRRLDDHFIQRLMPASSTQLLGRDRVDGRWYQLGFDVGVQNQEIKPPMGNILQTLQTPLSTDQYFVLGSKGLYIASQGRFTDIQVKAGEVDGAMALGMDGKHLWVARNGTLLGLRLSEGASTSLESERRLPPKVKPTALAEDWFGRFWLGTAEGLYVSDPQQRPLSMPAQSPAASGIGDSLLGSAAKEGPSRSGGSGAEGARVAATEESTKARFTSDGNIAVWEGRRWAVIDADSLTAKEQQSATQELSDLLSGDPVLMSLVDGGINSWDATAHKPTQLLSNEWLGTRLPTEDADKQLSRLEEFDYLLKTLKRNPVASAELEKLTSKNTVSLEDMEREDTLLEFLKTRFALAQIKQWLPRTSATLIMDADNRYLIALSTNKEVLYSSQLLSVAPLDPKSLKPAFRIRPQVQHKDIREVPETNSELMALMEDGRLFLTKKEFLEWHSALWPNDKENMNAPSFRSLFGISDAFLLFHDFGNMGYELLSWPEGAESSAGGELGSRWRVLIGSSERRTIVSGTVRSLYYDRLRNRLMLGTSGAIDHDAKPLDNELFIVSGESTLTPFPSFKGNSVGGSNNALTRDSLNRLWISTNSSLTIEDSQGVRSVVTTASGAPLDANINHILEDPAGRIWLAAANSDSSLWLVDAGGVTARAVAEFAGIGAATSLAWDPERKRLIVGGVRFLVAYDPLSRRLEDLWQQVAAAFHLESSMKENTAGTVFSIVQEPGGFLALLDRGLIRIAGGRGELVPLPHMEQPLTKASPWASMKLVPKIGVVVAIASEGISKAWVREPGSREFADLELPTTATIHAIGQLPDGDAILGGSAMQLLRLAPHMRVEAMTVRHSICPLRNDYALIADTAGKHPTQISLRTGKTVELKLTLPPIKDLYQFSLCRWGPNQQYLYLQDSRAMLVDLGSTPRVRRVELKTNPREPPGELLKIFPSTDPAKSGGGREIVLLSLNQLFLLDHSSGQPVFVPKRTLPTQLFAKDERLPWAYVRDGIVLASQDTGLWFLRVLGTGTSKDISLTHIADEMTGLPSNRVRDMATRGDDCLRVFTSAGGAIVCRESGDRWKVEPESERGFLGSGVRDAQLIQLGGSHGAVLATNKGVSLVLWPSEGGLQPKDEVWLQLDSERSLVSNDVRVVRWRRSSDNNRGEVWIGGAQGLVVFDVELVARSSASAVGADKMLSLGYRRRFALRDPNALPNESVKDLRLSAQGDEAWVLTQSKYSGADRVRLSHWGPDPTAQNLIPTTQPAASRPRLLTSIEPFLLGPIRDARLGPCLGGRPPRVLLQAADKKWWYWDPSGYRQPHLAVSDYYFLLGAQVQPGGIDPADNRMDAWDIQIEGARVLGRIADKMIFFPPDMFWPRAYQVHATLRLRRDSSVRIVASELLSETPRGVFVTRLVLFIVGNGGTPLLILWLIGQRKRRHRLDFHPNPYIAGAPIDKPGNFFGRAELLQRICSSLDNDNYALIGERRIGKTSIQRQLTLILRDFKHPSCRFFPVFVDMHDFGSRPGSEFFYFLMQHIVDSFRKRKDLATVLPSLQFTNLPAGVYSHEIFRADLRSILDRLEQSLVISQPRIVLQIDEVSEWAAFDVSILLGLRATLGGDLRLKVVLSGISLPKDLEEVRSSEWWNLLVEVPVDPLTPDEARELIVKPVAGLFKFDEKVIQRIITMAEGKPLRIQVLCQGVLQYKYAHARLRSRISLEEFNGSLRPAQKTDGQGAVP